MIWDAWPERWEAALRACEKHGGTSRPLEIAPPASLAEVEAVEKQIGRPLPEDFKQVLLGFSARVYVWWILPDKIQLPSKLSGVFSGDCFWQLDFLPRYEEERLGWTKKVFSNSTDPYDAIWQHALALTEVPTGDLLAFDLRVPNEAPIIYLSHDGSPTHGWRLGNSFSDFIERWSALGCVGNEDWQMEPFLTSPDSGLQTDSESATLWREWFGLQ